MSDPLDDAARRAWQGHAQENAPGKTVVNVERHVREQRNRKRRFLASAAIIVPGWIAVFWLFSDLRPVAAVGLAVGACLAWFVLRRSSPPKRDAAMTCAAFQAGVLERERDFHRAMPKYLIPVIIGQFAIVATLVMNPRFNKNAMSAEGLTPAPFESSSGFVMSLTLFIAIVIAALLFIAMRSRRVLREIEQELAVLGKGVEA